MSVALDVEGFLRNLAKAVKLVEAGESRDLRRASLYLEISLAALESHLLQRDVVVQFVDDPCHQDVSL